VASRFHHRTADLSDNQRNFLPKFGIFASENAMIAGMRATPGFME
jgi:hypothetical protein